MIITHTKKETYTVEWGEVEIVKVNGSWEVTYYNNLYVGSPFKLGTTFSLDFTATQVLNSNEVKRFLSRFN